MTNWTSILLIIILGACGQKSELSVENASQEFCNCFNSQTTGTVDERLSPCLQKIADKKTNEWNDSGIIDPDSIKVKMAKFSLDIMLDMAQTCDSYFMALNNLYDNMYPLDSSDINSDEISSLTIKIQNETNRDSLKSHLHKKVSKLIRARKFELAFQSIDSIKSLDNKDYGANLASAYIFNQMGLHDKAVVQIEEAIEISGNENLKLYEEIAKQKKQRPKK
jgi:hypothetical protein